jgi:uncharacterized DUF497 family protein
MGDADFEWDDRKAALNLQKHGVSFEAAGGVFSDAFSLEFEDDRHGGGELRFNTIGMAEGHVLFVVSTLRKTRTRIISARDAEPRERRRYYEQNET